MKYNHIKCSVNSTNVRKSVEGKNRNKEQEDTEKTVANMVDINPTISIITLANNGLYASIKRQRFPKWIKNKTQLQVVYKKLTLNINNNI